MADGRIPARQWDDPLSSAGHATGVPQSGMRSDFGPSGPPDGAGRLGNLGGLEEPNLFFHKILLYEISASRKLEFQPHTAG